MQYSVCHQTVFHFDSAPQSVVQRLHLTPLSHANQNVIEWDIKVDGGGIQLGSDDFHGNRIHLCEHDLSGPTMAVSCHGYVEVVDGNGIWGEHENAVLSCYISALRRFRKPVRDSARLLRKCPL